MDKQQKIVEQEEVIIPKGSGGLHHEDVENTTIEISNDITCGFDLKYKELDEKRISKTTSLVRATHEYENIFWYLKNVLDISRCAFYEGYSMKNGFTIELHHAPFTLYDICETVMKKHLKHKGYYMTFEVTQEVASLHYKFKVGLIPLNPTAHELVHNNVLPIHPDLVIGYWNEFVDEYKEFMSDEVKNKLTNFLLISNEDKYPKILQRNHIYLNVPYEQLSSDLFNNLIEEKKSNLIEGGGS